MRIVFQSNIEMILGNANLLNITSIIGESPTGSSWKHIDKNNTSLHPNKCTTYYTAPAKTSLPIKSNSTKLNKGCQPEII